MFPGEHVRAGAKCPAPLLRGQSVPRGPAATGGNWRGSSAGGEIDQAESARFRQDENRSESRNSGLRVEKRGLKRPGGPAFQDSGPPAWTFCCGSDRYCSGSHSQKPCIPTAFAGQGSWVTSASSHRCRPLLNPSVRVIGLRTSSVDDVMRLRAVTLASPHSGTATIAVLQRQCQRGHPRPGSSWSALTCSLAAANSASGDGPASTSWPPGASLDSPGARTHTLARSPRPSRSISNSPRRIIRSRVEGRGSRTGEGVPPSVNYKLEMRRRLSNRRETAGKPPGDHWQNGWKTGVEPLENPPENRRGTTGKNCRKTAGNRREKPRFWVTFASLNKKLEWPERASPASFFGLWGGLP